MSVKFSCYRISSKTTGQMFPSISNCASTEKHSGLSTNMFTDRQTVRQTDRQTDRLTLEISTLVKLLWSTSRRAKNENGTKWPTLCEITWVQNDPGTKWLEMKCVQVNIYVIIFKRSYVRTIGRPGKYHIYTAFPSDIDSRTVVGICGGKVLSELLW